MTKPSMTQGNPEGLASEKVSLSAIDIDVLYELELLLYSALGLLSKRNYSLAFSLFQS